MTDLHKMTVDDWLNKANDLPEDRVDYANNVRIHVTSNEVVIDFYRAAPDPKQPHGEPNVKYIQRIVLPLGVAKETGEILVKAMAKIEDDLGIIVSSRVVGDRSQSEEDNHE